MLQVLEKVKHENIVKLLAIEEEQEGRGKVRNKMAQAKHFVTPNLKFSNNQVNHRFEKNV